MAGIGLRVMRILPRNCEKSLIVPPAPLSCLSIGQQWRHPLMKPVRRDCARSGLLCCWVLILAVLLLPVGGILAQEKAVNDAKKLPAAALSIALDPMFGSGGFVADFLDAKEQTGALGRFLA